MKMGKVALIILLTSILAACGGKSGQNSSSNIKGENFIKNLTVDDAGASLVLGKSALLSKEEVLKTLNLVGPVSSLKISKDYFANEVSADMQYKNHNVLVFGNVNDIAKDITGNPYLLLSGSGMFQGVHAQFDNNSENTLAKIKKGEKVALVCQINNYIMKNVMLNNCEFLTPFLIKNKDTLYTAVQNNIKTNWMIIESANYIDGDNICLTNDTKACLANIRIPENGNAVMSILADAEKKMLSTEPILEKKWRGDSRLSEQDIASRLKQFDEMALQNTK